jgi:hypothetical protein
MTYEKLKEYKRLFDEAEAGGDSEHARFMLWCDENRHEIRNDIETLDAILDIASPNQ